MGYFFFLPLGSVSRTQPIGADVSPVTVLADDQVFRLRCQVGPGKRSGVGLHGQPVPGGGPELVKFSVTFDTALRAGVEGEFLEYCRACWLHLRLHQARKPKHHGHGR